MKYFSFIPDTRGPITYRMQYQGVTSHGFIEYQIDDESSWDSEVTVRADGSVDLGS